VTIHLLDIYRSSNIGIFLKCNEKFLLVPNGLAKTKVSKLSSYLNIIPIESSIGGSRLLGPLIALNNKGILVSRLTEKFELNNLRDSTGLPVERIPSKYTSIGNLISANDNGAVVSPLLKDEKDLIIDILKCPITISTIASYSQVGSLMISTNKGSAVHPNTSDIEINSAKEVLNVEVEPATVNGGVPFVSSGVLISKEKAVVGNLTRGPELIILSKVFSL